MDTQEDREETLSVRLTLAQAWVGFLLKAYDALLYHRINYRDLPEIKDTRMLDDATKQKDIRFGQVKIMDYLKRGENAILAKVRRKGIKEIK